MILKQAETRKASLQKEKENLSDEFDITSLEMEENLNRRLHNREALYLKKINAALQRIDMGTFGQCFSCEEEIEVRRLEARPSATFCVSCKEALEQKEKGFVDAKPLKNLERTRVVRIA